MKRVLFIAAFSAVPIAAQFGVPNARRQAGTNFEDLQELAQKKAGGADDADASLESLMQQLQDDPDYMKKLEESMAQFGGAMEEMMKMSPDEMAKQMEEAMKLFTDEDIVENVLNQKEEVLKSLESSGMVTEEELAKYRADPNYFEQKMRESFSQMGELFSNPDYVSKATEVMSGLGELLSDPDSMGDLASMLSSQFESDEEIEELRLQLLSNEFGESIPGFKDLFDTEEIQKVLKDPTEFREMIKNGPLDPAKLEL